MENPRAVPLPRSPWRAAIVLVVMLLTAALLALLFTRQRRLAAPATPLVAPIQTGDPAPRTPAATPGGERTKHQDTEPRDNGMMPTCWEGLASLDQSQSLGELRAAIENNGGASDPLVAAYLTERLTELIGDSAERALTVVDWAAHASPPALDLLLGAVKGAAAVHRPQVSERLLQLGEDGKAPTENRSAAVAALETQRSLPPAALLRLKELALADGTDSVAWMAARTVGRVMKEDFEHAGRYEPYWNALLDVGQKAAEPAVRLLALEMPSYSEPLLAGDSIAKLVGVLKKDPDPSVREMAALRLSLTREPTQVLAAFLAAFPEERDLCVRWAIFRFTVRVAGAAALPTLQRYAATDGRFRPDYEEFRALYQAGTLDFTRVWLDKAEHFQCPPEGGT